MRSGMECFNPIGEGKMCVVEKRADHVSERPDHAFGVPILLRCMGTGVAGKDAGSRKKGR